MEDNPLLVDMFLVVMFISLLTPSHSSFLYIQALLVCIQSSDITTSIIHSHIIIMIIHYWSILC